MMGNDIERILSGIDVVKEAASKSIVGLANDTAYQITTPEHTEELPVPSPAASFVEPIASCITGMSGDIGIMNSLMEGLYTDCHQFNNSYGSPWTELNKLKDSVQEAQDFASAHPMLQWLGEKAGLLALINRVMTSAVDARWAIMHFHDYIQRGYDNQYNGNQPSITFVGGKGEATTGNIKHNYNDNVNIPDPPIEVF